MKSVPYNIYEICHWKIFGKYIDICIYAKIFILADNARNYKGIGKLLKFFSLDQKQCNSINISIELKAYLFS